MRMDYFLVAWLLSCAVVFGGMAAVINYDVVVVFLLRAINAPAYPEARMVATLIYQHPEQWTASAYVMKHEKLELKCYALVTLELDGAFGHWGPSKIERRIIWDAVKWYRRQYIRSLLMQRVG